MRSGYTIRTRQADDVGVRDAHVASREATEAHSCGREPAVSREEKRLSREAVAVVVTNRQNSSPRSANGWHGRHRPCRRKKGRTTGYSTNATARCETAKVTPLCGRAVLAVQDVIRTKSRPCVRDNLRVPATRCDSDVAMRLSPHTRPLPALRSSRGYSNGDPLSLIEGDDWRHSVGRE